MAATSLAPGVPVSGITVAAQPFVKTLHSVFAQIAKGVRTPSVSFTEISKLGHEALDSWKKAVEQSLNAKIELTSSVETNALIVVPYERMSADTAEVHKPVASDDQVFGDADGGTSASDDTISTATSQEKVVKKGRAKNKAPRPKNAFIIYRQEWHPKIVKKYPGMKNNDISVVVGQQWRDEPEEVKEQYKAKADEEKRLHLIDNPGYQYQPRKPSEKKKRMTKNKLAKLRAQSTDSGPDPIQELDSMLSAAAADNQVNMDTFQAPYRQGFPTITNFNDHPAFTATNEHDEFLYNQLTAFNANYPGSSGNMQTNTSQALMGMPFINGEPLYKAKQHEVPVTFNNDDIYTAPAPVATPAVDVLAPVNTNAMANNSEADRQEYIFDDSLMNDLFDLEAFDVEAQ